MIIRARRAASLQEESRLTPSAPNPRRTMDDTTRTNKDIMCVSFPRGRVVYPPPMSRPSVGRSTTVPPPDFCLPAVTDGRRLDLWLLEPLLHLLRFFGWSRPSVLVPSLHPGAGMNHPHLSCITPAVELREYRRNAPATRAVCYHVAYQGKVRRFMTRDGRDVSRGQDP